MRENLKPIKLKQLDTKVAYYLTTKEEVLLYLNELIQKEKQMNFALLYTNWSNPKALIILLKKRL